MIDFIFSPFLALFSLKFYRKITSSSLGKGFLYLSYLSLIFSVGCVAFFTTSALPSANRFVDWFQKSFPTMTFTKDGVVTDVPQPFSLKHPQYGTLLIIDTSKEEVSLEEIRNTILYITKKKLYAWDGRRNEYRIIDLVPRAGQALSNWKDLTLTGPLISTFYKRVVPIAFPIVFVFCFCLFFVWKLLAGLFYSLVALVSNFFRRNKLTYDKLLNVSFFTLTPVTLLQWLNSILPIKRFYPNFLWSFCITSIFIAFAVLGTQSNESDSAVATP